MKEKHLALKERKRLLQNFAGWAVVTGATSGIGLELATLLAEAGFNVVINARTEPTLHTLKTNLESKYHIQAKTIAADVGTEKGIQAIIGGTKELKVGLFIAAAGFGTSGKMVNASLKEEVNLVQVNCVGVLKLTHHFSRLFTLQRSGGIILLSSMVAFQGVPYSANYAASKAYIQSLAEGLARELKPCNVHLLAAAPGPVASGFGLRANMKMNISMQPSDIGTSILKALGRKTTVLPGALTKILVYSLKMLPRSAKVRIMEKVMSGFIKHQERVFR